MGLKWKVLIFTRMTDMSTRNESLVRVLDALDEWERQDLLALLREMMVNWDDVQLTRFAQQNFISLTGVN